MKHTSTVGYIFLTLTLIGIPAFTNAHTDHPEEAIHNNISNFIFHPTALTIISLTVILGCIFWIFKGQLSKQIGFAALTSILLMIGVVSFMQTPTQTADVDEALFTDLTDTSVTLYKDPNCGCCEGYAAALRKQGFTVTVEETSEMSSVKADHNIPHDGASCHTTVIGDYVMEGHVPLSAVATLLQEQPAIAGIGLAGMPIGTPGMPGKKLAPYEVYQLSIEGEMSPFLTI